MKELRVVIADDSEPIRMLLEQALSNVQGLRIVGKAVDGAEAVKIIKELRPDLLVLDIAMPHKNGIEVLKDIRRENTSLLIVMFTADPSLILHETCLEAGANHYLDKTQINALLSICRQQLLDR